MSDLISRQAAMDALKEHFNDEEHTDTEYGAYWHHKHVLEVLEKLPSTQPEPCEDAVSRKGVAEAVEYYKKSVHHILGDCEFERVADAIHGLIRALPPVTPKLEQRWIPCSERLPEKAGLYTVSGGEKVWISEFAILGNTRGGWINSVLNPTIKAWMPLPEPYKEGEQDV